ncbi:S15/NS1 RNA-binding domain-containing protein [Rhizophagus irregularis]|uniref:Uncharacterized protein n=3 Tax=Rhizophagus irregularis TaxID=588596 RepID=U9URQ6_RHIID|nr:hypothetical protein GLOIN_2v1520791 [Rhizophagus irregularis DAOM 181602=DAOM 197198]EXX76299.1 hypothetical protein RirG_034380 [Rhizophagus irregularis DAOM 197198w]PKC12575.1 S15/NS1 RNA-binding domain-containing protein [Rhizophagus irregularis]PKC69685.1 S15/NS1 RNA-binding domain-containing protein [Rhizophagus irregularis]PKK69731.1 S15/NS1 RNA-binding domain-containing protein [Rhizophagus irregularis]PKY18212.1 S15/NS1 RNA-binding domain-containing protein [Rhizophagus irregularis|eukprot:XP_025186889.1 hypothetical protein GLOIN_2v1520791 [Rhizophagus irregularis DAOM 181602=DAOM 197198]
MFSYYKRYLFPSSNKLFTTLKARLFHSTTLIQKSHPREIKRRNIAKKISKLQQENSKRSNVITGIPTPFTNSLLRPSQIYTSANSTSSPSTLSLSENKQYRNFFLDGKDEEFLFKIAPDIIIENSTTEPEKELGRVQILKNLTGLHNASSKGILLHNIQLAIKEFARKEGDTGSAEVQAAVWTAKILNLHEHIKNNHKDKHNYRALRYMVHKRQRILKYLKTQSLERYFTCLKKLGLDQKSIEGEIVI